MSSETRARAETETETAVGLSFEVAEDRRNAGDWIVGAVDYGSEGECYTAIFTGSHAEARLREYAAWKNAHADASPGGGLN